MGKVFKCGRMVQFIKDIGLETKLVVMGVSCILMVMYIMENGKTTNLMDMEFIFIKMDLNMKDNGKKTYSMEKVKMNSKFQPYKYIF